MNALTPISNNHIAPLPQRVRDAVDAMASALDPAGSGYEIRASAAPTPEQREYLGRRAAALRASLTPAGPAEIAAEVAGLFASLAHRNREEAEATGFAAIYTRDLADVPAAALRAACADFRQGRAGDGQWAPTQAALRRRAAEHSQRVAAELAKIERILTARIGPSRIDPGRREAVLAHVRETVAMLAVAPDPVTGIVVDRPVAKTPAERKEDAEDWLANEQANPRPLPMLSDAARKAAGAA